MEEGQELRFVLDIQSPEDPEFTRRFEIVICWRDFSRHRWRN
ncbi:hypothetical protein ABJY94_23555 [Vibrio parahaemolyticus]|nr:hypothetical protein [Vibrio antiquarius]